jgi:hypothetical protein
MDALSLPLIGWLYVIACGIALGLGAWLTLGLHRSGEGARKQLAARALDDSMLFGIWVMGLAGGIGVLLEKSWSRWLLELFCWVLIILVALSCFSRWRATPPPRGLLALSMALFALPIAAACIATILALRGETAARMLTG